MTQGLGGGHQASEDGTRPRGRAPGFGRWHKASSKGTRPRERVTGLERGHQASGEGTRPRERGHQASGEVCLVFAFYVPPFQEKLSAACFITEITFLNDNSCNYMMFFVVKSMSLYVTFSVLNPC